MFKSVILKAMELKNHKTLPFLNMVFNWLPTVRTKKYTNLS